MYSDKIVEYYTNQKNNGKIIEADGIGKMKDCICGDIIIIYIKVKEEIIIDAKFKTYGCCAAIATSSMATELIKGKSIEEVVEISNEDVDKALGGLPITKKYCSNLVNCAIKKAIIDYYKKEGKDTLFLEEILQNEGTNISKEKS